MSRLQKAGSLSFPCFRRARSTLRSGLTLLELVVVMGILIALAAILVPALSPLINSANQAGGVTNVTELEKFIETFRAREQREPNHFDSLLNESGTISDLLPGPSGGTYGNDITVDTLTSAQAKCLSTAGIGMVYDIENKVVTREDFHPTLSPWVDSQQYGSGRSLVGPSGSGVQATEGSKVVKLKKPYRQDRLLGVRLNEEHDYVLLGIGDRCNLCGPGGLVKEAPIFHYPKAYGKSVPSNSYLRFCAVYDVGEPDPASTAADARFVCCVGITTGGVCNARALERAYREHTFEMAKPDE